VEWVNLVPFVLPFRLPTRTLFAILTNVQVERPSPAEGMQIGSLVHLLAERGTAREERGWQRVWKEHLDYFALVALGLADSGRIPPTGTSFIQLVTAGCRMIGLLLFFSSMWLDFAYTGPKGDRDKFEASMIHPSHLSSPPRFTVHDTDLLRVYLYSEGSSRRKFPTANHARSTTAPLVDLEIG